MKLGVYAGSFDPFTNGHLTVVKKAAKMFDKLIIVIGVNPDKKRRISVDLMKSAIEVTLQKEGLTNVEVDFTHDLISMYAKDKGADYLIRGIRTVVDYSAEEDLADKNEKLAGIDTIYLRAGVNGHISSTYVMELFKRGYLVDELLPEAVLNLLQDLRTNYTI